MVRSQFSSKKEWQTGEIVGVCTIPSGNLRERERESESKLERERESASKREREGEWSRIEPRCLPSYFPLQLCEAEWATERRERIWDSWKQQDHVPLGGETDALTPRKGERPVGRQKPKGPRERGGVSRAKITQGEFKSSQLIGRSR